MIVRILWMVFLFLAPFLLYGLYAYAAARARAERMEWRDAPWIGLGFTGLALVAASLAWLAYETGVSPEGRTYTPPRLENGRILPGDMSR